MRIQNHLDEYEKFINHFFKLYQASFNYQVLLNDIDITASWEVIENLNLVDGNSKILDDLPHIIELISNEFDPKLAEKSRSEDAVIIQGKLLNTAIANWSHQQQLI